MEPKKTAIQNTLKQNATNMIFYEDSFVKTSFFTKEISNWEIPIFYFDFDLQYTGFVRAGRTPTPKNLTLFYCQENDSFRKDWKSVIEKISNTKSLVIIDSLNGFFNLLEGKKDIGRLINSFFEFDENINLVLGIRYFTEEMPIHRRISNKLTSYIISLLCG